MNTESARKVSEFTTVLQRDGKSQAKVVGVPGHEGKRYQVIICRDSGLSVECNQDTPIGIVPCKGNSKSICYHCLAAIIKAASEKNQEVAFCDSYTKASKLLQVKKAGVIVKLTSWQSKKEVWLVVTGNLPEKKKPQTQMASDEFMALMEQHKADLEAIYDEHAYNTYRY